MKEDEFDKEIMDYLDGISESAINNQNLKEQAIELEQMLSELKELPLERVDPIIDRKMQQFIEKNSTKNQFVVRRLWPYIAASAIIIIMLFIFSGDTSFEKSYQKIKTNPDKLSFIYNLNNEKLSDSDIDWLQTELKKDINPNLKITIIDLLANYQLKLDKDFFNALEFESIPSVQMALLNIFESSKHIDLSRELINVSSRQDLDITVKQKANEILSKQ
jgi:hypothetical protein